MPQTCPRSSETRRAEISDVLAISRKSGVKTVRSRVMLIRHSPWPQGLRRDLECLSLLIDFLRRRILHPVISERMGGNPLPQIARSSSGMRGGKPAFSSRTATAFSDHEAAHVTMHYFAADSCCSAALRSGFRQLSSDECRRVIADPAPATICSVLHPFAPKCTT
jgi:hypothetical protein